MLLSLSRSNDQKLVILLCGSTLFWFHEFHFLSVTHLIVGVLNRKHFFFFECLYQNGFLLVADTPQMLESEWFLQLLLQ